jgi:hypothetical protein
MCSSLVDGISNTDRIVKHEITRNDAYTYILLSYSRHVNIDWCTKDKFISV